jgi:hypothetical protein
MKTLRFLISLLGFALLGNTAVAASFSNGVVVVPEAAFTLPITGDIDVNLGTMSIDPWLFFGFNVTTSDVEILQPGTYTRPGGNVTVPLGHIGAHMKLTWNSNEFYALMVWDVTPVGSQEEFRIIDSDGDGKPGHALTNGPFPGITVYYEFDTPPFGPPGPDVHLILNVQGGTVHECTGSSSAEVTVTAVPVLVGGAVLDSISWVVDGEDAGSGLTNTSTLPLGDHTIEATAVTTTGESDTESVNVTVEDTTRPVVHLAFLDNKGDEVDTASPGKYMISISASDACDPNPEITYTDARTTSSPEDGDVLFVTPNANNLKFPVTAVSVTVSARDASGNFSFTTSKSLHLQ